MTESFGLILALAQQHIHVLQQELPSIFERDLAYRTSRDEICGLGENPWVAKDSAADEHAADARAHFRNDIFRLETVAGTEDWDRHRLGDPIDQAPIGVA